MKTENQHTVTEKHVEETDKDRKIETETDEQLEGTDKEKKNK